MAAPVPKNPKMRVGKMGEINSMEEEMSRFEQEILTRRDGSCVPGQSFPPRSATLKPSPQILVPPGIPQALSVLGTPDPNFMNLFPPPPPPAPTPAPETMPVASANPPDSEPPREPVGAAEAAVPFPPHAPSHAPSHAPQGLRHSPLNLEPPEPPPVDYQEQSAGDGQLQAEPQQMSAPMPSFVPHQVRARPMAVQPHPMSIPRHPPAHQMQEHPSQMPQHPPQHRPPHFTQGPQLRMNYPMRPHGPPPQRPIMPPGGFARPPMVRGMAPVVIQAQPTTYSAKPVRFSMAKSTDKETTSTGRPAATITTAPPDYKGQTMAYTQPVAPNQPAASQVYMPGATAAPSQPTAAGALHQKQSLPGTAAAAAAAAAAAGGSTMEQQQQKKKDKKKKFIRTAASTVWEDDSLMEWDPNDFRIFCGDIGNEVTDDLLTKVFGRYPSFMKAKVVRDKRTSKSKGYGFVSFKDPNDFVQAMREWNGKYVGNRPIKLRKSSWKDRNIDTFRKKQKEKQRLGLR